MAGMRRLSAVLAAALALSACGDGNPFGQIDTDNDAIASEIPESISSDLDAFSFDPNAGTLTVTGIARDEDGNDPTYRRRPGLDIPGYLAFTAQEDPLDQHVTAYTQAIADVAGAVVATGGQFTFFNGGAQYTRTGAYDPQDVTSTTGLVTYAGTYAGLSNVNGPGTDLLPVAAGTPSQVRPSQAAPVTGSVFINVDFADDSLSGTIYNREITILGSATPVGIPNVVLVPTTLDANGQFSGDAQWIDSDTGQRNTAGEYGGIIGGQNASAMAGGVNMEEHMDDLFEDEIEFGTFVLGRCGTPEGTDPLCAQVDQ